jgi:DNA (cytosine-5)-methyltransferase 3A
MQVWQSKNFWNSWGNEKGYTIKTNTWHWMIDFENVIVRKLTPLECERLQTVPDNYTSCVSNSQRYKMLWNWWTVDVIAYIFKDLLPKN